MSYETTLILLAVLGELALLVAASSFYVGLIDRRDARLRARRSSPPTITALPRAIAIPTAKRRGQGYL